MPPTSVRLGGRRLLLAGLATLVISAVAVAASFVVRGGMSDLAMLGVLLGVAVGALYGFVDEVDVAHANNPRAVYRRDRRFVWVYALA